MTKTALSILVTFALVASAQQPGLLSDGRILLHNGWTISPAGESIGCGDYPLAEQVSPNGRYLAIVNGGLDSASVSVFEITKRALVATIRLPNTSSGICWQSNSNFLVSGGYAGCVYDCEFTHGGLRLQDSIIVGAGGRTRCIMGVDVSAKHICAAASTDSILYLVDLQRRLDIQRIRIGGAVYTPLVSKKYPYIFVSEWDGPFVDVINVDSQTVIKKIPVGYHPSAMVEDTIHHRLFVACANENVVAVIDIEKLACTVRLSTTPFAGLQPGSNPTALAISPTGKQLFIANAGNNAILIFNIGIPTAMEVAGWVPTGWYPAAITTTDKNIVVLNVKGSAVLDTNSMRARSKCIADYDGSIEIIPFPSQVQLREYTEMTSHNTPYFSRKSQKCEGGVIPNTITESSPIKHVFFIVKGASSYDAVLGDVPEGNGSRALCAYPENITPNQHALARQFALLDNFYADGDDAADGLNWTLGAYSSDYVGRMVSAYYRNNNAPWTFTGQTPMTMNKVGLFWDYCDWKHIKIRVYGTFTDQFNDTMSRAAHAISANMFGIVDEHFPTDNPSAYGDTLLTDSLRYEDWVKDFDVLEKHHLLPSVQVISLTGDRISNAQGQKKADSKRIAENDAVLGKFVETISNSESWKESAIFVIENSGGAEPDHVDAHRTVALVISPYVKRGVVSHTMYATTSMLKTIERIIGVPAMSEYDESAPLMCDIFDAHPSFAPFDALQPVYGLNGINAIDSKSDGKKDKLKGEKRVTIH